MQDSTTIIIAAFMSLIVGILNCFFGYAVYRSLIWVYGFLFGVGFGAGFVLAFDPNAASGVVAFAALLCGFFFGWLCSVLHVMPIILMGGATGAYIVLRFITPGVRPNFFLMLFAVLGGGVIAYFLRRYVLIGWTAVAGAALIINGFLLFVPGVVTAAIINRGEYFFSPALQLSPSLTMLCFIFFIGLSIGGIVFQYWNTKELAFQENRFG